ncbi:MAG: hypothetical protein Kow001_25320 [Acidobacteriota bacterium]
MAQRPRILYVVGGSCCRGLMAEGLTRYLAGQMVEVETAGPFEPTVDPYCQWAMNEAGVDISLIQVEPLDRKHLSRYTHVIALDPEAEARLAELSVRPSAVWRVPDPAAVRATPAEKIRAYRAVRNHLEKQIKQLLAEVLQVVAS